MSKLPICSGLLVLALLLLSACAAPAATPAASIGEEAPAAAPAAGPEGAPEMPQAPVAQPATQPLGIGETHIQNHARLSGLTHLCRQESCA